MVGRLGVGVGSKQRLGHPPTCHVAPCFWLVEAAGVQHLDCGQELRVGATQGLQLILQLLHVCHMDGHTFYLRAARAGRLARGGLANRG